MATPERDTVYTTDANRTVYARESNGTAWFVGIIVVLALLAIGYLVFSANSGAPASTTNVDNSAAVTTPAPDVAAPAAMTAPAADTTPSNNAAVPSDSPVAPAPAPAGDTAAPAAAPAPAVQ